MHKAENCYFKAIILTFDMQAISVTGGWGGGVGGGDGEGDGAG